MEQQWQSATLVPISAPASRAAAPERTQGAPALDAFALFRLWWADIGPRRDPATARLYRYNVFSAFAQHAWDPVTVSAYRVSAYLDTLKP